MPNAREKLAHLIVSDLPEKDQKENATAAEKLADRLIANGVTVRDSHPLLEVICDRFIQDHDGKWYHQFRFKLGDRDFGISKELPEELVALAMMEQQWIPVTERLPEDICPVLVAVEGLNTAFHGWYQDERWWAVGAGSRPFTQKVTHWMPLPEPPKEE